MSSSWGTASDSRSSTLGNRATSSSSIGIPIGLMTGFHLNKKWKPDIVDIWRVSDGNHIPRDHLLPEVPEPGSRRDALANSIRLLDARDTSLMSFF